MDNRKPRIWSVPEYSKKEINDAGNAIRSPYSTEEEREQALKVIDNRRASHAFPLQVFFMNLKRRATDDTTLVAQRLKRLESIVDKLGREQGMELYRMQDLGGCRMVVSTVKDVYEKSEEYKNSRIRHIIQCQ